MISSWNEVVHDGLERFKTLFTSNPDPTTSPDDNSPAAPPPLPSRSNASTAASHRAQMPSRKSRYLTRAIEPSLHGHEHRNARDDAACDPIEVSRSLGRSPRFLYGIGCRHADRYGPIQIASDGEDATTDHKERAKTQTQSTNLGGVVRKREKSSAEHFHPRSGGLLTRTRTRQPEPRDEARLMGGLAYVS